MTPKESTAILKSDIEAIYNIYNPDLLDDTLVMQRFGQQCRNSARLAEHLVFTCPTGAERKDTVVHTSNLPLFDSVERPQVGTADAQNRSGGQFDPQSHQQRPARLLLGQQQEKRAPGRPRRSQRERLEIEEGSCALRDTAQQTDMCTCPHIRAGHRNSGRGACNFCDCPQFTKASLTLYDERAAANRRTP